MSARKDREKERAEEIAAYRNKWKTQYTQAGKMIKALTAKLPDSWEIEELDVSKMHGYYSNYPDLTVLGVIDTAACGRRPDSLPGLGGPG